MGSDEKTSDERNINEKVSDQVEKNVEKAKNLVTPTTTMVIDNEPAEVTVPASTSDEKTSDEKTSDEKNIVEKVSDKVKKNVEKAKNLVTRTSTTATDNEPAEVTETASTSEEKTIVEKVSDKVKKNVEKAKNLVTPTTTMVIDSTPAEGTEP